MMVNEIFEGCFLVQFGVAPIMFRKKILFAAGREWLTFDISHHLYGMPFIFLPAVLNALMIGV